MKNVKKRMLYYAAACTLFVFFLLLIAIGAGVTKQKDCYEIICFGDSIFGQVRDDTSVSALLAQKTGMTVYNGAFGGTCFARLDTSRSLFHDRDALSFAALSQAVAYEDFQVQNTVRIKDNGTDYFEENLKELESINFAAAKVFVIAYGMNDYSGGVPFESPLNPKDPYTFMGAMRSSIEMLQKRYPQTRILLVGPTYRWIVGEQETGDTYSFGSGTLARYRDAERIAAQELGVEFLDHYELYTHESPEDWLLYTTDGLHPNPEGREMIAQSLADYLK
jgi:lysophospholipase L1-like esterase